MNVLLDAATYGTGDTLIVSGVSLSVRSGEPTAVIGPNGAGKSTVIRLLAGDIRPHSGSVRYDGQSLHGMTIEQLARLRSILRQGQHVATSFTVEQVVEMARYAYRGSSTPIGAQNEAIVTEAIDALDLGEHRTTEVKHLSGGEQQRTAIAKVIAQQTPLVLLDEPMTALDMRHQNLVMGMLLQLSNQQRTVIAVLHDLNMAAQFQHVVLMNEGHIVAAGSPVDVMTSESLSEVFASRLDVVDHPRDNGILILPYLQPT